MINLEKIEQATQFLKENDAEFVGLFGSHARGEETDSSDIDLLVRFSSPKSIIEIIGFERILSERFGKRVEIITEPSLNPRIAPFVLQDLQPMYGKR
ncbi:MAG: nucleotidyltransferase domain-containing protein [Patescibacteria group bacterium]